MEEKIVRLTRKELYKQVWDEPMATLAQQYGLSDVGLAKICKKHNIPRPGRGYWARKQYMKSPPVISLPNPADNLEIEIREHDHPEKSEEVQNQLAEAKLEEVIPVPETLRGAHTLVHATLEAMESSDIINHGLIISRREGCLGLQVSKNSLRRALRIMDGLIKALEAREYKIVTSDDTAGAMVEVNGQRVGFRIDERLEVQKTEKEVGDLGGRYEFRHNAYRMEQAPSGRLCLEIFEKLYCNTDGLRRRWSDGKKQRLEDHLAGVIAGMIALAARQADKAAKDEEERLEHEAEKQRREEQKRTVKELAARIRKEKANVDKLLQLAEDWRNSKLLREYITAVVEANAKLSGKQSNPDSELGKWIEWANCQADRLDPLVKSPPSILDKADEVAKLEAELEKSWW